MPLSHLLMFDRSQIVCKLLASLDHQVEKTLLGQPPTVAPAIVPVGPD